MYVTYLLTDLTKTDLLGDGGLGYGGLGYCGAERGGVTEKLWNYRNARKRGGATRNWNLTK